MEKDYIIVGGGIAGLSFATYCQMNNKSFVIIDSTKQPKSSMVAVGLFNPIVLKRFTAIWQADEQMNLAEEFYKKLEDSFDTKFLYNIPLYRKISNVEEQNNWFTACDKPSLKNYLNDQLIVDKITGVDSPFGFGELHKSAYLDTKKFVSSYHKYLQKNKAILYEEFDYNTIKISDSSVQYKDIFAKNIVFAEGFFMHNNPFFNQLPLDGTKGEVLTVRIPNLKTQVILKTNIFVLPIGEDLYRVGATYNWHDKSQQTTEDGKQELINDLKKLVNLPFEVVSHVAGVRPTVRDRKPLVGKHLQYNNMYLLNGLGTRGVLLGPYLANQLFNHIENKDDLPKEIDIKRYYKKLNLL